MAVKVKGKAETKMLAERLMSKAENPEHDDLVEVVLTCFELQGRVYDLEKKHQDLVDNLRIFIGKEEDEKV